ncbi:Hypothetical predicted protein [Octopus vulgaris]|uniref:Uncharacterized protein n=1 Tax=Octopus vulgaris TaxID=6645 RepID=A0AA36BBI1_OCTVU|nr:Hypothetical predicted protein [Octopus vulgaris]
MISTKKNVTGTVVITFSGGNSSAITTVSSAAIAVIASDGTESIASATTIIVASKPGIVDGREAIAVYNYKLDPPIGNANCHTNLPMNARVGDYSKSENRVHIMDLIKSPVTVAKMHSETRKETVLSRVNEFTMNGCGYCTIAAKRNPYFIKAEELSY